MKSLSIILTFMALGTIASEYPLPMLQRPFTMPKNSFESSIQFKNSAVGVLSTDYGITDDFQLGLSWAGMSTNRLDPAMQMSINAGYFTFANNWIANMVVASLPLYFEKNALHAFALSAPTAVPIIRGHLGLLLFYDDLVALDWENGFVAKFNFPLRLNWQATDRLFLRLGTNLATLSTNGEHNHLFKTSPLTLSGLFAVTKNVDILGSFGFPNLQKPTDMVMMLGVAFRGGALDG